MKINKTYTLRFVKLPPAAIALGKPFDIIFSLTDDLGLEVPSFPDIRVAFEITHSSDASSEYIATDTVTKSTSIVINSYKGSLHKASLQVTGPSSSRDIKAEDAYLVLKLAEQLSDASVEPIDPLDRSLMEFVQTDAILNLYEDDIVALVVPTCAGPLALRTSKKDTHSSDKVSTTEVHLSSKFPLRIVERPLDKIIGDHVWHGSIVLAHAVLQGALAIPPAKAIVELGAGCGLVSLSLDQALGKDSRQIIATDLPEVVESTLKETLLAHAGAASMITSKSLAWDDLNDAKSLLSKVQKREALWILAADVLYNPSSHAAFLQTICDLSAEFQQRTVTIAYRPRAAGDDAFFQLASDCGFPFTKVLELADAQIWQHSNQ